jgi:ankyrin repeat protein
MLIMMRDRCVLVVVIALSMSLALCLTPAIAEESVASADGTTPLHVAVHQEDVLRVKALLADNAEVDAKNRYEVTPLAIACLAGNSDIVAMLLEAGADPNLAGTEGETPLMTASRTGRVEVVDQLLTHGARVNETVGEEQMAIHWAASEGHAEVVRSLIRAGANPSAELESGFTPLLFAARQGHRDVVKVLIEAGADLKAKIGRVGGGGHAPRPGTTALMFAVENGHFELALDLVKAGVDPNEDMSGFAPLHALAWVRKPNRGDGPDGVPSPYGSGSVTSLEFVRQMVALGADVNRRVQKHSRPSGHMSFGGATPFFMAADTADVPWMRLLVELGADPTLTTNDGTTPLLATAGVGTFAPGEEAGTEPEMRDAILYALELGGDINAVNENGETVMHGAAYKGIPAIVELLATQGANIEVWNRDNKYGWTPLSIAEGYRHGNFRPLADMVSVIEKVMREEGVEPVPHKLRGGKAGRDPYAK